MNNMRRLGYRPDIDGLRAIAVLSVLVYHGFPSILKGGFVGVDVFFVISGYLITTIILSSLKYGDFSYGEFYARRIRRIFPALILVILFSILIGYWILLSHEYKQLGKFSLGGVGFVANLIAWGEAGYFDSGSEYKPLLHLWSLGVEEQFYLVWPVLIYAIWRFGGSTLATQLIVIIAVVSFSLNVAFYRENGDAVFYSPITRIWELMLGGLLANYSLYHSVTASKLYRLKDIISLLGILLIFASIVLISETRGYSGWWALMPVTGTLMVIWAGPQAVINRRLLSNRSIVWLGLISYTLYLWHWPLFSFAHIVTGISDPSRETRVILTIISIVLAWLTYKHVEMPIRKNKGGKVVVGLVSLMIFTGIISGLVYRGQLAPRLSAPQLEDIIESQEEWTYPEKGFRNVTIGNQPFSIMESAR